MKSLQLNQNDNVAIAILALEQGETVENTDVSTTTAIPPGHKVAINAIKQGEAVYKYGQIIGSASADIQPGDHVHSHNLGMGEFKQDYAYASASTPLPPIDSSATFMGFKRSDGQVGTRNYVGILTSVNCAGTVARIIADAATDSEWLKAFPNIDGIVPIVHGTGCGMSSSGESYDTLFRTLSGYAQNPNFSAILMVGLGCEIMQISALVGSYSKEDSERFRYMTIQESGGTRLTVERGLELLQEIAPLANQATRTECPASSLVIGMQCGGSDGYSGLGANPALGAASDLLIRHGGTTFLSETPEIYGAEHLLTRRAINAEVGEKLCDRISWWEDYCERNRGEMDNNPSPGNKRGGLTTILEKSLGAVAKGGTAPLSDVILYAERTKSRGLVFMDSPGYDPASCTGQIASGANIIIFTTGRGSVSGYKPTPCIKLSSNTAMYERLSEDMDLNCGDIIDGDCTIEEKGEELFNMILAIASGEETKSEALGFGGAEFVPWQIGAVM